MSAQMSRVFLVEDDPEDARLLEEALREIGADVAVEHATDGKSAGAALDRAVASGRLPAVIVLDLHLGAEHGADLLREWRMRPDLRDVPVAVLTSSSNERDIQKARAAQATSYYLKPKSLEEYLDLARDLVVFWLDAAPREHA